MQKRRSISPDLEAVERDIDAEYKNNRLAALSFAEAAWYFLAFCEERLFKHQEIDAIETKYDAPCFVDNLVNSMKTPLRWLRDTCAPGDRIPREYCADLYEASWEFSRLMKEYSAFEAAYIYARAGVIDLALEGDMLVPFGPWYRRECRYEAYDRLWIDDSPNIRPRNTGVFTQVASTVTIAGEHFFYRLSPGMIRQAVDDLSPMLDEQFWLPAKWQLPQYTFGDFRTAVSVLRVMAMIHHVARVTAAHQGCIGMGYASSVLTMDRIELSNRIQAATGLNDVVIGSIVRDLTYGERGIRNPDPALQPLIPLTSKTLAVPPALLMGSDLERNLTVLLNRLPSERDAYSRLSTERELRSRPGIMDDLQELSLRSWHGKIPGRDDLPDIDLALIDDNEHSCLVLELKAFVGPAEPREIVEKSEEIERGVAQIRRLREAFEIMPSVLTELLGIDGSYAVQFAVATETFVGTADVQDVTVPVVRTSHLVQRLLVNRSLAQTSTWL